MPITLDYRDARPTLRRATLITPWPYPERLACCSGPHPYPDRPRATGVVQLRLDPGGLLAEAPLCDACAAALPPA